MTTSPYSQTTIDVVPEGDTPPIPQNSTSSSALVAPGHSFSATLAPLNKETFRNVVRSVERDLGIMKNTLDTIGNVLDSEGFEAILNDMLQSITLKTGELLSADRSTIFLLDRERNQLWSIVAIGGDGKPLEIRIPANKGIAGECATSKEIINIPFDFYDDPRSTSAQEFDKKTSYRTYNMLALPLVNEQGDLVAVVQLLNKVQANHPPDAPLAERVSHEGFTDGDIALFDDFAPSILLILESSQSFYQATQKQRAAQALMEAINSLSKGNLDLDTTLNAVMDSAKKLMNAARSTLWLLDTDRNDLWTKIPMADGQIQEFRVPVGVGYVGKLAEGILLGEHKENEQEDDGEDVKHNVLNIGFDLYEHPDSGKSKELDEKTGFRTCSLLCMPVFNADDELIGVTQLVNKEKPGEFEPYNPENWPNAPEQWRASFNGSDQDFMYAFNIQAGVALQNAKLFAQVKQQEQMQRDILRSLTNGVISTDKNGCIIAANEKAKALLGFDADDPLEGKQMGELLEIKTAEITGKDDVSKKGIFSEWLRLALAPEDLKKDREQYYPDQPLLSAAGEEHSVNLSINSMSSAVDPTDVYGALIVMDDISDEKRLKSTMYRYMTQELAEQLLASDDFSMGGDRKDVSILFSDIRSYTSITEQLEAEEVVTMLNHYFEKMVEAVFKHQGTLDKYIGDAIMAVFGSPLPLEDHAWQAVQTAVEMRHRLADFNADRTSKGHVPINIGIGINSGSVISGNIGSSKRMEFTAIGDGVNISARLETASKQYGCDILISDNTYNQCSDKVVVRELDRVRVKGKKESVTIYELVALVSESITPKQEQVIELYHQARDFYLNRDFARALTQFARVLEISNHDKSAKLHMQRCQYYFAYPPDPDEWDGVWTMTSK
ncbi:MAG: GAF domain-containing protein [Limnothrix sp. RL_2_0]|nr:GAF domain-containing protein [Limnothrix sp. RL_2_0]